MSFQTATLELGGTQRASLTKGMVSVGRTGSNCDIIIDDSSVSREHAQFLFENNQWYLQDLGSRNKTFVNQEAIPPHTPIALKDGLTVHFGFYATTFRLGAEADPASSTGGATMAFDVHAEELQKLFAEDQAAPKPKAAPKAAPKAPSGTDRSLQRPIFAHLDLHSVTNPVRYDITEVITGIGTDPAESELVIVDSMAADRHAEIRFQKGKRVTVKRCGGNSIKVNGRIVSEVPVQDGDDIEIGESRFTFRLKAFPEAEATKKKVSPVLIGVIGFLFLGILAMGGAYYYVQFVRPPKVDPDGPPRPMVQRDGDGQGTTADAPALTRESALEAITTRNYAQAIEMLKELAEDGDQGASLMAEQAEVLRQAVQSMNQGDFAQAHTTIASIPRGQPVWRAGEREIQNIERRFQAWLDETRTRLDRATAEKRWDDALDALEVLSRHDAERASLHEDLLAQIEVRSQVTAVYDEGLRQLRDPLKIASSAPEVLERATGALADIDAKLRENPDWEDSLGESRRRLRDLRAHADFMVRYFAFDGDTGWLAEFASVPGEDYERHVDIRSARQNLEGIAERYAESQRLLESIPRGSTPTRESFTALTRISDLYNEILSMEPRTEFRLGAVVRDQVRAIEETKRDQIRLRMQAEVTPDATRQGRARLLDRAIRNREKFFDVMRLFPEDVTKLEATDSRLQVLIDDPELRNAYRDARRGYATSMDDAVGLLMEGALAGDANILPHVDESIRRLRDSTLQDDETSQNRIDGLEKRLVGL